MAETKRQINWLKKLLKKKQLKFVRQNQKRKAYCGKKSKDEKSKIKLSACYPFFRIFDLSTKSEIRKQAILHFFILVLESKIKKKTSFFFFRFLIFTFKLKNK